MEVAGLAGVIAVMSPDTRRMGSAPINSEEAQKEELYWFANNQPGLRFDSQVSIFALLLQLNKTFGDHISKVSRFVFIDQLGANLPVLMSPIVFHDTSNGGQEWVPRAKRAINKMRKGIERDLRALGPVISTTPHRASRMTLLARLQDDLQSLVESALAQELAMERTGGVPRPSTDACTNGEPQRHGLNRLKELQATAKKREELLLEIPRMALQVQAALASAVDGVGFYLPPTECIQKIQQVSNRTAAPAVLHRHLNAFTWLRDRLEALCADANGDAHSRARSLLVTEVDQNLGFKLDEARLSRNLLAIMVDGIGLRVLTQLQDDINSWKSAPEEWAQHFFAEREEYVSHRADLNMRRDATMAAESVMDNLQVGARSTREAENEVAQPLPGCVQS